MGQRRDRRDLRIALMQESRQVNGLKKRDERARREARLRDALKKSTLPYTPVVLSWLSAAIDKPGRLITQADVDQYLKS